MNFKNKKVLIFGLGSYKEGSGVSAARFFIRHGARVTVTDMKTARELGETVRILKRETRTENREPRRVVFHLGGHRMEDVRDADILIRNPGVPNRSPYLMEARQRGIPIYTDVSFFMTLCPCPVIGVTGTRGKSTTTALIGEMLKRKIKKTFVGGNIQRSPLTFLNKLDKNSLVVLELSSWLLESFADIKKSPHIAVVTNIYSDHLNVHGSMREYVRAKENIFRFCKRGDFVILNRDNAYTRAMRHRVPRGAQAIFFSVKNLPRIKSALKGAHNESNSAAAATAAEACGVSRKDIAAVLQSFHGLPSRQEIVRVYRGVMWVNDTTATTPEATMAALYRFRHPERSEAKSKDLTRMRAGSHTREILHFVQNDRKRIVLIAGGADKKMKFRELAREIKRYCKAVILFDGTATIKIVRELPITNYQLPITIVKSMQKAVHKAKKIAQKGDIVLLSPGATSFGLFKNEFDRGDQFVRLVRRV